MIKIKKNREPAALTNYRKQPFASYEDMHGAKTGRILPDGTNEIVYNVVLNHLMKEQGYICAYCMRRIPERHNRPHATIEHIDPQSKSSVQKGLDYQNMLAVCSGNRNANSPELKTCDARRENTELSLNPLQANTISTIAYRSNGRIYSHDPKVDDELNRVLNLNCAARDLIRLRKSALTTMLMTIRNKGWDGNKEKYRTLLQHYQQETDMKTEYVGILISWLAKRV